MNANGMNGQGWKSIQWGVLSAIILGSLTGGIAMWRSFTLMQERLDYLLRLNEAQNRTFDEVKTAIQAADKRGALLEQRDLALQEKLKEHDAFLYNVLDRLRKLEQASGK